MPEDVAVRVSGVSKTYRVYEGQGRGWLLAALSLFGDKSRYYREVHALRNVDFELKRGGVLGIMGRNGSGKSTLLKLVAGLSLPTSGSVEVQGRIRALLALGVNFHPMFSGRENILFGSMAMGVTRREAVSRVDEILDFAELQDHADIPIHYYSSGMRSRLAAAVAFQETPEILIIDEALAAGDAYFVSKCMSRIEEMCRSGSTVLFVSHGIALIERLCDHAILLEGGELLEQGEPSRVVNAYRRVLVGHEEKMLDASERVPGRKSKIDLGGATDSVSVGMGAPADGKMGDGTTGTGEVELLDFQMFDVHGEARRKFDHGEGFVVSMRIRTRRPIPMMRFYLELYSEDFGVKVAEIGSNYESADTRNFASCFPADLDGEYELRMECPDNPLGSGRYYWNVYFAPTSAYIKFDAPSQYFVQAYRVHPFLSRSFPGHDWADNRKALLEPPVRFSVIPGEPGTPSRGEGGTDQVREGNAG